MPRSLAHSLAQSMAVLTAHNGMHNGAAWAFTVTDLTSCGPARAADSTATF